jgi:hypothetical protein
MTLMDPSRSAMTDDLLFIPLADLAKGMKLWESFNSYSGMTTRQGCPRSRML